MQEHNELSGDDAAEAVGELVGRHLVHTQPRLLENDDRFMTWLARDLRRRPPSAGDWSADRVRRLRERVLDQALCERAGVTDARGVLRVREAAPASVGRAVDAAHRVQCAPWIELGVAAGAGRELWEEECDCWVELPPGTPEGRHVAMRVVGDSMVPLLQHGDAILVRLGGVLRRDSICVARRPDHGCVVKRVGRVWRRQVELVSLNPTYAPVVIAREPQAIVGTVVLRWKVVGAAAGRAGDARDGR